MKKGFSISMQGTEAELRLIGDISWWKNSGAEFTNRIDELINSGVTDVNGYIKTGGGDVIEANEIYNQIKRFTGKKHVKIGAICASAGTIVADAFDTIEIAPNGQYMIHEMTGFPEGTEKDIEAYLQLMKNLKKHYVERLMKRTGLPKEEIEGMISATTWMDAKTCQAKGFVNSISNEDDEISNEVLNSIRTYGYKNVPQTIMNVIEPPKPQNNPITKPNLVMKHRIIAALKLHADATDDQISAAVEKLVNDRIEAENKLRTLQTSVAQAKAKILVDNAIAVKKITESEREAYMKDAIDNYDLTERMLNKIPEVKQASHGVHVTAADDRSKWTFKDYMEKAPEDLIKLRTENRTLYAQLYKAHYGMECKIED